MINESTDVIATILVLVAPFALVLFVVVLVIAYPWLLLIAFAFWYLIVKYVPDVVPTQHDAGSTGETPSPSSTAVHDTTA